MHQLCCPVSNTREGKQRTNWVYLLWFLVKEIRQKACVSSPVELPFEAVIPINQLVSSNETMKSFDKRMKSPLLKAEAEVVETSPHTLATKSSINKPFRWRENLRMGFGELFWKGGLF